MFLKNYIIVMFDKEKVVLSNLTHMMSMVNPLSINVETPKIDNGCSLKKEFTKLINI